MQRRDFGIGDQAHAILEGTGDARVAVEFQIGDRDEIHFLEQKLGNAHGLGNAVEADFDVVSTG